MNKRILVWLAAGFGFMAALPVSAQIGPGGVVGGNRPATRPGVTLGGGRVGTAPPVDAPPAVPIVAARTFPAQADDPIERPDFASKVKPIAKNITSAMAMMVIDGPDGEIGLTADVIATVTRNGAPFSAGIIKKQAAVGPEMQTSFDEAVRAVQMRYPKLEPARIEFSFGDKYTPHEGGSAGTCFGTMLLSTIEGFEIDPKCAVTGDITVNWKVRKIGGLPAKVRGAAADKCLYTGVPLENRTDICDMVLFYGDQSLRDIQVFSLSTLQDAVALLRKDRSPQMVEAMKEFAELNPKLIGGRGAYALPANVKVLENIVALAPNHESAKMMLEMGKGTFPRTVSLAFALDQFGTSLAPYQLQILGRLPVTRQTVTAPMTQATIKNLAQLDALSPPELKALIRDSRSLVQVLDGVAAGTARPEALGAARQSFISDLQKLDANKDFTEKLMRSGM